MFRRGIRRTLTVPVANVGSVPRTGVSAVSLNLTVTNRTTSGFITACPTGIDGPGTSKPNFFAVGRVAANLTVVPVGQDGTVSMYNGSNGMGYGVYGELGNGTPASSPTPVQVSGLADVISVSDTIALVG